jgi:hypothetical protein
MRLRAGDTRSEVIGCMLTDDVCGGVCASPTHTPLVAGDHLCVKPPKNLAVSLAVSRLAVPKLKTPKLPVL